VITDPKRTAGAMPTHLKCSSCSHVGKAAEFQRGEACPKCKSRSSTVVFSLPSGELVESVRLTRGARA